MGVDGPRGRAQGRGWGLTNPYRTDTFDIDSTLSPRDVLGRIDAQADRVDFPGSWHRGKGVARRGQGNERQLAVRHWTREGARPVAFVRVWPDGTGSRVSATIRPTPYDVVGGAIGSVVLLWFVMSGMFGVWIIPLFAGLMVVGARRSDVQRERLRTLIESAAG